MVNVDTMITTAGALLAGLAIEAPLTSAVDLPIDSVIHMRALATASSAAVCVEEGNACAADSACLECNQVFADQSAGCAESIASSAGVDTDICGVVEDLLCCSTDGCWDNAAYAALLGACVVWMICVCMLSSTLHCETSACSTYRPLYFCLFRVEVCVCVYRTPICLCSIVHHAVPEI